MKTIYSGLWKIIEKYYWILFGLAGLLLAFLCFQNLGGTFVDSWDEARHGVNAYEMIQNGNYIGHTYNYEMDYYNLKPSISYWFIALGFQIFGYNTFGLRFFSALAYLLTGILAGLFLKEKSKVASLLTLGFFCTNTLGFQAHMVKSGDADALYVLFFTVAMLAMMQIQKNKKAVYICGGMFALAFLTKSFHAGVILAIGGLYFLGCKLWKHLKVKEYLGFLGSVLGPILVWAGIRATQDGVEFFQKMIEVDVLARTSRTEADGYVFPFSYYYDVIFNNEAYIYRWLIMICFVGIGVLLYQGIKKKNWKREYIVEAFGYGLWFFVPFLAFSSIGSKLIWYCYPCLIPLFMVAARLLGAFLEPGEKIKNEPKLDPRLGNVPGATKALMDKDGDFILKLMVGVGIFILIGGFVKETYTVANTNRDDRALLFQTFISESVERDSSYAGADAYVYVLGEKEEDLGTWDQNMLFVGEIAGDYHCMDGGVEAFLEAETESVLYIDRARIEEWEKELEKIEILEEHTDYVLYRK